MRSSCLKDAKVRLKRKGRKECVEGLQYRLSVAFGHLKYVAGKVAAGIEPNWFQDIMKDPEDGDDGDGVDLEDEDDQADDDEDDEEGEQEEDGEDEAATALTNNICRHKFARDRQHI